MQCIGKYQQKEKINIVKTENKVNILKWNTITMLIKCITKYY